MRQKNDLDSKLEILDKEIKTKVTKRTGQKNQEEEDNDYAYYLK